MNLYIKAAFVCFLLLLAVVYVGIASFDDEVAQEEEYCYNVKEHVWPDFKQNYKIVCFRS